MRPVPPPPLLSPLPSSSPEEDEDGGDDDASTDGCDIKTEAPAEVEDSELWDNGESACKRETRSHDYSLLLVPDICRW